MKDFYAILEIQPSATAEEITAAYKKLIKQWHPDINRAADALEKTKAINEAYDTLNDPVKKVQYDLQRNPFDRQTSAQRQGYSNININVQQGMWTQVNYVRNPDGSFSVYVTTVTRNQ